MAASAGKVPVEIASPAENPYELIALDVDGVNGICDKNGQIKLKALNDALKAQENGACIEIFTARDKKGFKLKVLSWLQEKIQTVDTIQDSTKALQEIKIILRSIDAFKIETIRQALAENGLQISQICNVRDCMPGGFFGSRTLGSYYGKTLQNFESKYCEILKKVLVPCIRKHKAHKAKSLLSKKIQYLLNALAKTALEEECPKHKGDLISLRLTKNAKNLKNKKERKILKVNCTSNSSREAQQIDYTILVELQLSHAENPTYLRYKRSKILIISFDTINYQNNKQQETLLHYVCRIGDLDCAALLINVPGIDLKAKNKEGKTYLEVTDAQGRALLHQAAARGHITLANTLILQGADIHAQDTHGKTYLEVADARGRTLLHHVAAEGDMDRVHQLIALGANINARDKDDSTPLDLLKLLLKIRLETVRTLKITLEISRKELKNNLPFSFFEKNLLATLKYTGFGKKYSSFVEEDMNFWRQSPSLCGPAYDFCEAYIEYCIKKLEEDIQNLETENPLFSESEISIEILANKQKQYSRSATPKKPVAEASHSEQTLYVLQEVSPKDQTVIPVAILSNTQAKAPDPDTDMAVRKKSYYDQSDIKPIINGMDFYRDCPALDLRDRPGEGLFYMSDLTSQGEQNQSGKDGEASFESPGIERYYFEVTVENGFQIKDPTANQHRYSYFYPYNGETKLCERFKAVREYFSARNHLDNFAQLIATTKRPNQAKKLLDARKESIEKRKKSILKILNAEKIQENESAETAKALIDELSKDFSKKSQFSPPLQKLMNEVSPNFLEKPCRNKLLDLCQASMELDSLYETSLFEEVIDFLSKIIGFVPTKDSPNINYDAMIRAIVMVANRFALNKDSKDPQERMRFKAWMKNWIVLLRENKELQIIRFIRNKRIVEDRKIQEAFAIAYEDISPSDETLSQLLTFCHGCITFDQKEIEQGRPALLSQTVISFMLYEENERIRAIALVIRSTLNQISENPIKMALFTKLLEIFIKNMYAPDRTIRIMPEKFIERCNEIFSKAGSEASDSKGKEKETRVIVDNSEEQQDLGLWKLFEEEPIDMASSSASAAESERGPRDASEEEKSLVLMAPTKELEPPNVDTVLENVESNTQDFPVDTSDASDQKESMGVVKEGKEKEKEKEKEEQKENKDDIESDSEDLQDLKFLGEDIAETNPDEKRPVALLDVDYTLLVNGKINERLLMNLDKKGIKDIYLLTDMNYCLTKLIERIDLIAQLSARGFRIHGVITPADLMLRHVSKEDVEGMREYAFGKINPAMLEKIKPFYEEDLQGPRDEKKLGSAFRYCEETFGNAIKTAAHSYKKHPKSPQDDTDIRIGHITEALNRRELLPEIDEFDQKGKVIVNAWIEQIQLHKGYDHPKGCLLKLFMAHKPNWVGDIIVFDDRLEVCSTVQQIADDLSKDAAPHMKAIHIRPCDVVLDEDEAEPLMQGKIYVKRKGDQIECRRKDSTGEIVSMNILFADFCAQPQDLTPNFLKDITKQLIRKVMKSSDYSELDMPQALYDEAWGDTSIDLDMSLPEQIHTHEHQNDVENITSKDMNESFNQNTSDGLKEEENSSFGFDGNFALRVIAGGLLIGAGATLFAAGILLGLGYFSSVFLTLGFSLTGALPTAMVTTGTILAGAGLITAGLYTLGVFGDYSRKGDKSLTEVLSSPLNILLQ